MTFVSDTFADTANTALQSHTADQGGPWVRHPNSGAVNMAITAAGTRVRISNSGVSQVILYYATGVPAAAEYDVQADFILLGAPTGDSSGITGRMNTSLTTMYLARYDLANTRWQLAKIVSGSLTDLGTFTQTLTLGQTYVVKLQIRDAAKKLFVDGVERISSADNGITSTGVSGFRVFTGSTPSDAASLQWDNFAATDLGSAPTNTLAPVVSGIRVVGQTLTTTTGTWTGGPTFTYQWQSDAANISGQTASTYVVQSGDAGHNIRCVVTGTNGAGAVSANSNGLDVVAEIASADVQFWTAAGSGLGGSPAVQVPSATAVYDAVSFAEAQAGDIEYRVIYLKNTHAVRSLGSTVAWIVAQTTSGTTDIAIGVAQEAAGSDVTPIADESTAPVGVTFSAPATEGAGLSVGTLAAGQSRGIWLRRTVGAGTVATPADTCTLGWSGTPA